MGRTEVRGEQIRDKTIKSVDISPDALVWQQPVEDKDLTSSPASPSKGDRYIIAGTGGGWSGGTVNDIAQYNGASWDFYTPVEGWFTWVKDENKLYKFDGSSWAEFAGGAGGGDMYKSTYDTDDDGIVDNSEKLEGQDLVGVRQGHRTESLATIRQNHIKSGQSAGGDLSGTYPNPTVGSGKVSQAKLKTTLATGYLSQPDWRLVSLSGIDITTSYATYICGVKDLNTVTTSVIAGGSYSFYPQVKRIYSDRVDWQNRYITSSGKNHWLFLLYDKSKKKIISGWEAPDHPSYGNGGDETEMPHPFCDYWNKPLPDNLEIILVDNEVIDELKAKRRRNRGMLEIINEEYEIDFVSKPTYKPREIIEVDEWGNRKGDVLRILDNGWKLKRRYVTSLPSYISYKKIKLKGT